MVGGACRRERPSCLREPAQQRTERAFDGLEERGRNAARRDDPEGVPVRTGILGRDQHLAIAEPDEQRPPLAQERLGEAGVHLVLGQVPCPAEQVVELVGIARGRAERGLDLLDGARVEQLPELLDPHELAQQVAVERERLRAPLGRWRVVLVHVGRHVLEEKRRGERGSGGRLHLDQVERPRLHPLEQTSQRGQVEDVLEALAVRLENDRELRVAAGDLEQALSLQPLLPQRRALSGATARDEKRPRRVLPEARAEERRLRKLGQQELLDLLRPEQQISDRGRRVGVGEVERDPVVRPERLRLDSERVAEPRRERQRPRRVDPAAERREDAHPPVADLVAEALDDDDAIGREHAGGRLLLTQVRHEVLGSSPVEVVLADEPLHRALVVEGRKLPRRASDPLSQLGRAADALALPERGHAGHAGRGRDEDAVARDRLDPPGRGAEEERLALARLVDHLLVELADPPAAVDEEHSEEPAVRDRPCVRDREPAGAEPSPDDTGDAVPDDPRPQLRELVGRVPAGEHVEDVLERRAREVGERVRAPDERVQVVDRDLLVGADRDDLLRDDVDRVPRDVRLLDLAFPHRSRDDGRLEQITAELREDPPLGDRVERVAGSSDPLEASRDRLRALHLDHEVDGAHVDSELERRRRDEARDLSGLQQLLDQEALLASERSVVRSGQLLARELVEPQREALREAPAVDEDDRRPVLSDELEDRRVDGRPDRARGRARPGRDVAPVDHGRLARRDRRVELPHVLERDDDLEVELLAPPCVHELDVASGPCDEAPDLLHGSLRRRQADALQRPVDEALQPLERQREMGAALRARHGMDLVDDDGLDAPQRLARLRGEQEEQRLGSRDQDVRRRLLHAPPLVGGRVARSHADRELRAEPRERAPEVALDVVVQSLERGDVQEPQAVPRGSVQPVDADEERSERLAGARRRLDEDVPAAGDRRPPELLRRRRRGERAQEPLPGRRREDVERIPRLVSVPRRSYAPGVDFDVVVVGGGTAGCVLAARLSENPDRSVCLLEAGPDYGPLADGRWPPEILDPRALAETHDWGSGGEDGRTLGGRVLGGSSSHNACMVDHGLAGGLRRVGARLVVRGAPRPPRPRASRAQDRANEHRPACVVPRRVPRGRAGRRVPTPPRPERSGGARRRRPVPCERRRRPPVELRLRVPRPRARSREPHDHRRHARRPGRARAEREPRASSPATAAGSVRRRSSSPPAPTSRPRSSSVAASAPRASCGRSGSQWCRSSRSEAGCSTTAGRASVGSCRSLSRKRRRSTLATTASSSPMSC